jgi:deoxycytidine triphosphate deaminase
MADLTWSSPPEHDPKDATWEKWTGSVLTSDEIDRHCSEIQPPLIDPYDAKLLKPARYQLRLGPEARVGGEDKMIDKDHPLVIPPHQVAIVRTRETLVIPRYLIGRWNLTVGMVYKGLLWVGALQVDPGWVGYLPCPLYNMSNQPVRIDFEEKLFTIDFVRTTPVTGKTIRYPYPGPAYDKPINPPLSYYDRQNLRSGPYQALRELQSLAALRDYVTGLIPVVLTVLAVMVAALGVVVARPAADITHIEGRWLWFWPTTALAMSAVSLGLAVYCVYFVRSRYEHH